jgi:hypothetical protein
MNTVRFVARRRGKKVIIMGKVPVSAAHQGPYLKWIAHPRTDTRAYELCYRKSVMAFTHGAETLELVVHEESDMADFVRTIRIRLPNDREYVIESQAPPKPEPELPVQLKRPRQLGSRNLQIPKLALVQAQHEMVNRLAFQDRFALEQEVFGSSGAPRVAESMRPRQIQRPKRRIVAKSPCSDNGGILHFSRLLRIRTRRIIAREWARSSGLSSSSSSHADSHIWSENSLQPPGSSARMPDRAGLNSHPPAVCLRAAFIWPARRSRPPVR